MKYDFPVDITLDEVRSVIKQHNMNIGADAFIEADRGDLVIFNYVVAFENSFPEVGDDRFKAIVRECRGITFDKASGKVVNRKFHKFFNVNEKDETQIHAVDWSRPHKVLEKLDGSMITPLYIDGEVKWATKMGMTEVAEKVYSFTDNRVEYIEFCIAMIANGYTPIFEWCSRKQKIVIDYPEDRLVLTAIRCNSSGRYETYESMVELAEQYDIDVVRALPGSAENIQQFLDEAKDVEGEEGYIIRFDDGHMVKVKGMWYVQIHKTKESIQSEKNVWQLILNDRIDDAKSFMDEGDRAAVSAYHDAFEHAVDKAAHSLYERVMALKGEVNGDRKEFATKHLQSFSALEKPMVFRIWDGFDPVDVMKEYLAKNSGSGPKIDNVRPLLDGLSWEDYRDKNYSSDE